MLVLSFKIGIFTLGMHLQSSSDCFVSRTQCWTHSHHYYWHCCFVKRRPTGGNSKWETRRSVQQMRDKRIGWEGTVKCCTGQVALGQRNRFDSSWSYYKAMMISSLMMMPAGFNLHKPITSLIVESHFCRQRIILAKIRSSVSPQMLVDRIDCIELIVESGQFNRGVGIGIHRSSLNQRTLEKKFQLISQRRKDFAKKYLETIGELSVKVHSFLWIIDQLNHSSVKRHFVFMQQCKNENNERNESTCIPGRKFLFSNLVPLAKQKLRNRIRTLWKG